MRYLNDRKEIAREINIKKTTVVRIDLADADCYGLKSQKLVIKGKNTRGKICEVKAEILACCDDMKFVFSAPGICIHDGFGYGDMEEMIEYANAPIVEPDSDVVLAIVDSKTKRAFKPMVMHTGNVIDEFCSTPISFIDEENNAQRYMKAHIDAELVKSWFGERTKYLMRKVGIDESELNKLFENKNKIKISQRIAMILWLYFFEKIEFIY